MSDNIQVEKGNVPMGYIPIQLQSGGKLSTPKVFHMRDYTMEDVIQLNTTNDDNFLPIATSIFNRMIYENKDSLVVDSRKMHVNEFIETIYTLFGTFVGSTIEKEYYINLELPEGEEEGQLDHSKNIATAEIPINKIGLKHIDLDEKGNVHEVKFKEPFSIYDPLTQNKFRFRLSRIGDIIDTEEYCDEMFSADIVKFQQFKYQLDQIRRYPVSERREVLNSFLSQNIATYTQYQEYLEEYNNEFVRNLQCRVIIGINEKVFDSLEQKVEAYTNIIPKGVWDSYNEEIVDKYTFGLLEDVTFYSKELEEEITRRFSFQFDNFLPDTGHSNSRRNVVSFD